MRYFIVISCKASFICPALSLMLRDPFQRIGLSVVKRINISSNSCRTNLT